MGQSASADDTLTVIQSTREELHANVTKLTRNLDAVDVLQLAKSLNISPSSPLRTDINPSKLGMHPIFISFIQSLASWPNLSNRRASLTLRDILVAIYLISQRLISRDTLYRIFWLSLSPIDSEIKNEKLVDIIVNNKSEIQWHLLPIVQSFDEIELPHITKADFHILLEAVLPMHTPNRTSPTSKQIFSISHVFFNDDKEQITFDEFMRCLSQTPRLLDPISEIFIPLLHPEIYKLEPMPEGKILPNVYAQISTFIPLIKPTHLYSASKHGFSLQALQTHITKYPAPTLFLLRAKITDSNYSNFFKKFPHIHLNDNIKKEEHHYSKYITIGAYLNEPWAIKGFGDSNTKLVMLLPTHELCITNPGLNKLSNAYLNQGVGFGATPPTKHGFNIYPGVSITIDPSLEYGVWRSDGQPGTFRSSIIEELWFHINEVEVWGLGDESQHKEQKRLWEWEEREAERRKHINKDDVAESRALLELAGLVGANRSGGSI
ncbi:Rtc5 protein [Martiniozyma asiatica (nom. inval.)]|nr:Rtc5 protein [Martiniozyma asiatica]